MSKMKEVSELMQTIEFTPKKVEALRVAYKSASKAEDEFFYFEGNQWVVGYAKYALEYLDMQMKKFNK